MLGSPTMKLGCSDCGKRNLASRMNEIVRR
jgi:hypothetical protein